MSYAPIFKRIPPLCLAASYIFILVSCIEATVFTPLPPGPPKLFLPQNDSYEGSIGIGELRPRFEWKEAANLNQAQVFTYELQYSTEQSFTGVITTVVTRDLFHQPESPLPVSAIPPVGQRYYWRVRTCISSGCSDYSPIWRVNLGRAPKDFNGDGYSDIAVGAPRSGLYGIDSGSVYVYFGGPGNRFDIIPDGHLLESVAGDFFGSSISSSGDVNGDGYADLLVGVPGLSPASSYLGKARLYLGGPGSRFNEQADSVITSIYPGERFGDEVEIVGDVNGDGRADVAVGAPSSSRLGTKAGRAYVYFGRSYGLADTADRVLDIEILGETNLGSLLSSADTNGDGFSDIIVSGQSSIERLDCIAHLYLGSADDSFDPKSDALFSIPKDEAKCIPMVGLAGDIDRNGIADLFIVTDNNITARLYLFFGDESFNAEIGRELRFASLTKVSAGDVNGDGTADLVALQDIGMDRSGIILLGRHDPPGYGSPMPLSGSFIGGEIAITSFAGDLNGDGLGDVLVGTKGVDSLEVRVYFGTGGESVEPSSDGILLDSELGSLFGSTLALQTAPHVQGVRQVG